MKQAKLLAILFFATGSFVLAQNDDSLDDENIDIAVHDDTGTPPRLPPTPDAPRKRARQRDLLGFHGPRNLRTRLDEAAQLDDVRVLVNAMNVIIPAARYGSH